MNANLVIAVETGLLFFAALVHWHFAALVHCRFWLIFAQILYDGTAKETYRVVLDTVFTVCSRVGRCH
jgi:hypothetical protein